MQPITNVHFPIQPQRLRLRPFALGDLDDVFAYMSRPEVVRYLYGDVKNRRACELLLNRLIASTTLLHDGDALMLAVESVEHSRVMGEVMLKLHKREHRQAEIGWVFHPNYAGQGYATEAAAAVLALGFDHFGFHRIFAGCDARNAASYRLMERLGMRREAALVHNEIFKGEWGDEYVYALLEHEWAARVAGGSAGGPDAHG